MHYYQCYSTRPRHRTPTGPRGDYSPRRYDCPYHQTHQTKGLSQAVTFFRKGTRLSGGGGRKWLLAGRKRDFIELKTHPPLIQGFPLIPNSYGEISHFRGFSKSRICIPSEGHPIRIKPYNTIAYTEMVEKHDTTVKNIFGKLPRGRVDGLFGSRNSGKAWPAGAGRTTTHMLTRQLGRCRSCA
jgi:hypothetical protein